MEGHGFECIFANEFIHSVFRKDGIKKPCRAAYEDTMRYLKRLEDAAGNRNMLLIGRATDKISSYGKGEVLLYGTAEELDTVVQRLDDVAPIKGFFYSDSKSPEEVAGFIRAAGNTIKCVVVIDVKQNDKLRGGLAGLLADDETEVFSVYSEQF